MKVLKKLIVATIITALAPTTYVHAMDKETEEAEETATKVMPQHLLNFSLGLFISRINQVPKDSVAIAQIINLLREGADVNAPYLDNNDTPATLACKAKRPDILKILILAGADLAPCISARYWKGSMFEKAALEAQTEKQRTIASLSDIQTLLRDNTIQSSHLPIKNVAHIVAEYALPYYNKPEYELLNDFVTREWTLIKND